jgi:cytochrome c2
LVLLGVLVKHSAASAALASGRRAKPAVLLCGVASAALVAAGCGAVGRVTSGNPATGKTLFVAKCGSCHVLAAAGTTGTVGPSLDDAFRADKSANFASAGTEQSIRDVVRGQIAYAERPMPTDLVSGKQADDVAFFVAKCAAVPSCTVSAGG